MLRLYVRQSAVAGVMVLRRSCKSPEGADTPDVWSSRIELLRRRVMSPLA